MVNNIKHFKISWNFHRGNTLELLKTLSDEELSFTMSKNMGTLGQQFRHLARVDDQYISAIETGKVQDNRKKMKFPMERSVARLTKQLKANNKRLFKLLDKLSASDINNIHIDWRYWKEKEFTLIEHLETMVEHEILHHGELIVYFRSMNKKFPDSWKAWGV